VLALMVGAAFAFLLDAVDRERSSSSLARHSEEVLVAAQRLDRLVLDLENGQRGFAITHDPRSLAPWRAARRAFPLASQELLDLTVVSEHHAEHITSIFQKLGLQPEPNAHRRVLAAVTYLKSSQR
jgi:CHASE3 domain sensor protein